MNEPVLAIPVPLNSKTAENLKKAFGAESRSNDRYMYFASVAEAAHDSTSAAHFKKVADDKHKFAQGHLKELIKGGIGDPDTGKPSASLDQVLETAIADEMTKSAEMYSLMAHEATVDNLPHIADWFIELEKIERMHAQEFRDLLKRWHEANGTTAP